MPAPINPSHVLQPTPAPQMPSQQQQGARYDQSTDDYNEQDDWEDDWDDDNENDTYSEIDPPPPPVGKHIQYFD